MNALIYPAAITLALFGLALALATLIDLIERAKETMNNELDDESRRDGGQ